MDREAIFDMEQLLRSTCDDPEFARQVVGVFLADAPRQFDELENALAAGDAAAARRFVHSLKGSSAAVGGHVMRAAALECERLCHQGEAAEAAALVEGLRRHFADLRDALLAGGFGPA